MSGRRMSLGDLTAGFKNSLLLLAVSGILLLMMTTDTVQRYGILTL